MVPGCNIDFVKMSGQKFESMSISFDDREVINVQIQQFLAKGVIQACGYGCGQFTSVIFTRPKKYRVFSFILNLKTLNQYAKYHLNTDASILYQFKERKLFRGVARP